MSGTTGSSSSSGSSVEDPLAATASPEGFSNWRRVTECIPEDVTLYRSSAPWNHTINPQALPERTLNFLINTAKIKHIISLNTHANDPKVIQTLAEAKIAYTPLETPDWKPPTMENLRKGIQALKNNQKPALVWCGAGCGRTGTMVTAIQMSFEAEKPKADRKKFTHADYEKNDVEKVDESQKERPLTGQYEALDAFQSSFD